MEDTWQLKDDLYSLFQHNTHAPIDGLRSISCLMIIVLHIITFLNSFITPYPTHEWMTYLKSYSFRLSTLLSLSLETFFMLSGFLLTLKCIEQNYFLTWKGYSIYIFRRACRFWPGILLITIVMLLLGEPKGNWMNLWLFYQNYVDMEQWSIGFASLWSISLDMQMHILLPVVLYMIVSSTSNYQKTYSALYMLIILSIVYSLFVFNPQTMDLPTLVYRYNSMALLMPQRIFDWIITDYNVTLAFERPGVPSPIKPFMEKMYLPVISRYSSFIIGSVLALNLMNANSSNVTYYGKMKKYLYFTLIWLYMLILTTPVEPAEVNHVLLTVVWSITRQLFSTSQAFILFSALCPSTHPYHSSWIRSFLSLSIWTPIAKLSYLIYILHFRIAFELIMSNTNLFDLKQSSIDSLTPICLVLVLIICLILAIVWFVLVEKPFERVINQLLSNNEKLHTK
ncbi:unnamed protein product [Rotaria sp. Silwood2]|nr:unnamed protein product [Rotaria sp. Silwood2]CAF2964505.1 unnamed protein product [Rotaria sp. Silwood2]CAF3358393.1 unnamed protein product [Rotaria sp. Silwood2]CAF3446961.1 unnamed protein product [Rotaria sp. Silwood2]CAF3979975.1 unnamed protein product [Rotaria sp. Silwood2]